MKKLKLLLLIASTLCLWQLKAQGPPPTNLTPDAVLDTVYDRFGNKKLLKDIMFAKTAAGSLLPAVATLSQTCGYFNVYYANGSGMEIPLNIAHINRRNVICQLLTDMSAFINSPLSAPKINILIDDMTTASSIGAAGVASGYYAHASSPQFANPGIADNEIWKTIHAGVDSYTGVAPPVNLSIVGFYHGFMAFDFTGGINWNELMNVTASPTEMDLYTVGLHELTHALGFASLINSAGISKFGAFNNYYSRYDLFLKNNIGQSLLTNTGACSTVYGQTFNSLIPLAALSPTPSSCINDIVFAGSVNQKCFTPTSFLNASSLSHFEDICHSPLAYGPGTYYVMNSGTPFGITKRFLKQEERMALCDLGYKTNTTYGTPADFTYTTYVGACNGVQVAGICDGISGGSYLYTTTGTSISIPKSVIISNDYALATPITPTCIESVYANGTVAVGPVNVVFTASPGYSGPVLLRYVPQDANGVNGNITYIYGFIYPSGCSPVSPCDMIQNGGFENVSGSNSCGNLGTQVNENCWYNYKDSPDIFTRGCLLPLGYNLGTNTYSSSPIWNSYNFPVLSNNKILGLYSGFVSGGLYNEVVQNYLGATLTNGTVYNLNYKAYNYSGIFTYPSTGASYTTNPLSSPCVLTIASSTAISTFSLYPDPTKVNIILSNTLAAVTNTWVNVSTTFTYTGPSGHNTFLLGIDYNANVAGGYSLPNGSATNYYILIDDVSLNPASLTPTLTVPTSTCFGSSITDLGLYAQPPGGSFAGTGISGSGTMYNFNSPATLSTGTYSISYTYTNTLINCSYTAYTTITITPPPPITASAAPSIICAGQSTTLTATGATSYTWMPGGLIGASVVVSPASFTQYTVSAITSCGTTATTVVTVKVNQPTTLIATANPSIICLGNSSTLTVSGLGGTVPLSYVWAGLSSTTNTAVVTPTTTTTYTVGGTVPACGSYIATVSVNVVAPVAPPAFSILAPITTTNVCANGTGTNVVSFNTNLTGLDWLYNWTPGSITTPTANIDITQTTLITVSVTHSFCPLAPITQTIAVNYVNNKCCLPFTGTVLTSTNIVGPITLTGNYKVPTGNVITYSGNVNLLNCTFLMGEGSRMVAMPRCSLVVHNSKIFSCEGMWFGIEMKNNSIDNSFIQVTASKIEDAFHAIHASVGSLAAPSINLLTSNINNTLNKNYVDVYIENWNSVGNTYPFMAEKTDFLSKNTVTSPGGNLKTNSLYAAPFIAPRSNIGIYAASATSVNVVSITFTLNINTFENKDYGIFMKQTHATINNADFKNMSGFNGSCTSIGCIPPNPTGVGIISSSNFGGHELNVISLPLAPITFNNLQCAVYANRLSKVTVTDVDINNPAQTNWGGILAPVPKGIGYNGIYLADILSEAHVNYNTIKNTYYGVQAVYSSTSITSASPVVLSISNNTISTAGTHTTQTAINVSNALVGTVNPSSFPIAANTLTRVKNGIYAQGMAGGLRISNNSINLLSGSASTSNGNGIYLRGGNSNCVVDNNSIFGNSTGAVNTYPLGKLGINILTSPNCFVQCNTIEKVGIGIQYDGVNGTSNDGFFSNTLNYPIRRGLVLKNNGFIGTQGSFIGTPPIYTVTATSENQWAFPWNTVLSDQTYINDPGSAALGSRLCVSNNPIEKPNDNQWNSGTGAVPLDAYVLNQTLLQSNTAAPVTSCPLPLTVGAKMAAPVITSTTSPLARDAVFNQVITQTIPDSTIAPETKWMLKQHMHRTIKQSAVPTVTTVQSFYAVSQTQSVNTYFVVDSLITAGLLPQAIIQNSSATSTCVIEQNHKDFNQLWLTNLSDTSHMITFTDIGILQSIANQCIHKGGRSVAQARAMLASINFHPEEYDDDCFGEGKRMANPNDNEEGVTMLDDAVSFVNVFPNPNNGIFTINYNLVNVVTATILVEDITGKLIYSMGLDVSTNTLNLNLTDIVNGIYFVKIKNKDAIISVNKVIINN